GSLNLSHVPPLTGCDGNNCGTRCRRPPAGAPGPPAAARTVRINATAYPSAARGALGKPGRGLRGRRREGVERSLVVTPEAIHLSLGEPGRDRRGPPLVVQAVAEEVLPLLDLGLRQHARVAAFSQQLVARGPVRLEERLGVAV